MCTKKLKVSVYFNRFNSEQQQLYGSHSFQMGSVRFTERYLRSDPLTEEEVANCQAAIAQTFSTRRLAFLTSDMAVVGVSGTVTTAAATILGLERLNDSKLNGFEITLDELTRLRVKLSRMSAAQRVAQFPVLRGREDLVIASWLILEGFMAQYSIGTVIVSTGGIRHGLAISAATTSDQLNQQ